MEASPRRSHSRGAESTSTMSDPQTQEKKLRDVVVSLSKKLKAAETNEFVYTYRLPQEYHDKAPLTVLQMMHQRGMFSAAKPEDLAKLMRELNRMDLVQTVQDELIKKKARKKAKTTDSAVVTGSQSPSLSASTQAKLEVSDIQSRITSEALNQSLEMVKETPQLKRVEEVLLKAKHQANHLCSLIKYAQELHDLYVNPGAVPQDVRPPQPLPIPNEQASDDDDGNYYSQPRFSDREKTPTKECDSDGYMCMDDVQPDDVTDAKQPPGTQMVTGVSASKTKPQKPATRPKPAKQRLDGSICKSMTLPPSSRKQPAIGADDIQKGKSMLRRASGTKLSSDGCSDDADCTGGSCTGEDTSTGDSGFGDVGPLLKVKPVRKPQPTVQPEAKLMSATATDNYYKRLGSPDYIEYYSTVTTKDSCDNGRDEVYANADGAIYANLPGTVKQHRNIT